MKSGKPLKVSNYNLKNQFIKSVVESRFKWIIDESSTKAKRAYNNSYDFHIKSNYRISNEMQVFQFLQRSPNFMGFIHTGPKHVTWSMVRSSYKIL